MASFAPHKTFLQENNPLSYSFSQPLVEKTVKYITGDRKAANTVLRKFTQDFARDPKLTERFFNGIADLNRLHLEGKTTKPEFLKKTREAVDRTFPSYPQNARDSINSLMLDLYVNAVLGSAPRKVKPSD